MIRTASIYHDPQGPEDGHRLLVMRHWPRGVRKAAVDGWLKDLGPSRELLRALREGRIEWEDFVPQYRSQVEGTEDGRALMGQVKDLEARHSTVTLICHEDLSRPGAHCHRTLLKELLDGIPPSQPSPLRGKGCQELA